MPGLLFPLALLGLLSLAVPLLIHLARREETKPVVFAALRFLTSRPKPVRKLRFDDWPLLILRLLLLALIAFWLARPVWFGGTERDGYVAVVPGIDAPSAEAHWLASGFPSTETPAPEDAQPTASLIRQLDAELPKNTSLTIIVPETFEVDAGRLNLTRKVNWQVVPGGAAQAKAPETKAPGLVVVSGQGARYIYAASVAWAGEGAPDYASGPVPDSSPNDKVLVWLSPEALPGKVMAWIEQGGTVLLASTLEIKAPATAQTVWRDATGAPLAEGWAQGKGRVVRFTRPLTPAEMPVVLEADFPSHLKALLVPDQISNRVVARDYAPSQIRSDYARPAMELQPWLAVFIALLALAERALASLRKREGTA